MIDRNCSDLDVNLLIDRIIIKLITAYYIILTCQWDASITSCAKYCQHHTHFKKQRRTPQRDI